MIEKTTWNGFNCLHFDFEDRKAILVEPKKALNGNPWLLKTEYFDAFPNFEIAMLEKGYHLAYLANKTRWYVPDDADSKERFSAYLEKDYNLAPNCIPVGMSCGGMHAVYFAAKYPKRIKALYIDAPVLNLLSCPCKVGVASELEGAYEELLRDTPHTVSSLINYREHPIDFVPKLIENRIPVALICGDSDRIVPYCENGEHLSRLYRKTDIPFLEILKEGCDHHPHGLEDPQPIIDFIESLSYPIF